jgi:hypothetical protein
MSIFCFLGRFNEPFKSEDHVIFHNVMVSYGGELLTARPTPKLEDLSLSAVRDLLFSIFGYSIPQGYILYLPPEDTPYCG